MRALRGILLLAVACVASTSVAYAAGKRYALLVGVGKYPEGSGFPVLPYAERDAEVLARVLVASGYDRQLVRVLTLTRGARDPRFLPTLRNIRRELELITRDRQPDDSIVIALAGHGFTRRETNPPQASPQERKTFFCPLDSDLSDLGGLLPLGEIYTLLAESKAGGKLLLVDAARWNPDQASTSLSFFLPPPPPDSVSAFYSSSANQLAWDAHDQGGGHGVFFHHVIEALKGDADQEFGNKDGYVSLGELVPYVQKNVEDYSRRRIGAVQAPYFLSKPETNQFILASPRKSPGPPAFVTRSVPIKLLKIVPTVFRMGSPENQAADYPEEKPQHQVRLTRDYYLGQTEITQAQYLAVTGKNPSNCSAQGRLRSIVAGQDTRAFPVENVSWFDAIVFCNELSRREKLEPYYLIASEGTDLEKARSVRIPDLEASGYRLPTEAEWEFAARAGVETRFPFGDTEVGIEAVAWFADNSGRVRWDSQRFWKEFCKGDKVTFIVQAIRSGCQTHPVASLRPNAFDLYDMHGNVQEWCADAYRTAYYRSDRVDDPINLNMYLPLRSLRGGSFADGAECLPASRRLALGPTEATMCTGFRIALTLPQ